MDKSIKKINGHFLNQDIISLDQFTASDIKKVLAIAKKLKPLRVKGKPSKLLAGKIITLVFYEPSSRTFASFSGAAQQLGASTIAIPNATTSSSVAKGESLSDTIKTFESYSDAIVMRHPEAGSAKIAADAAIVPFLNAGDGGNAHPTQGLLDLLTIYDRFKKLDQLVVLASGDVLHSRTIRSLIDGLSRFKKNTIYLLSPKELRLDKKYLANLPKTIQIIEIFNEKDIPTNAHVWYWNRIQKERFSNLSEAAKYKGKFILTQKLLDTYGNKKMIVMDPLPRVGEIEEQVDNDSRSVYLKTQMRNGLYIRMALLALVLGRVK